MALPLKYNFRNITVRKSSSLATAFTIGLTVGVYLMVMALAHGIDLTLASSDEPNNLIVLREGSTAELNSSVTRDNLNNLIYLDGVERVKDPTVLTSLAKRISDDQRLLLKAVPERVFYEDQQGAASGALKVLAVFIAFIMSVGAGFAGMNTMYAAVARRTKEIGTLRVLGFSRRSILASFVLESVAIALIGVGIGILLALPLNFVSTGTSNFSTFSEIAFNFRVTPDLMLSALIFGAGIGLLGSLLPSIRASRFKIVDALRAS